MSRFNPKVATSSVTTNFAGGTAYKISKQEELLRLVTTSFFNDSYYRTASQDLQRLKGLVKDVASVDPLFVLGLTVVTRDEYNMRTMSHILLSEVLKYLKWDKYDIKNFVKDSIVRVDDMTEILGYLLPDGKSNKKARSWVLSHGLVKGLREVLGYKKDGKEVLGKFDEYQLAKYDRNGKAINLKDVVRLAHSNSTLAEKILTDSLATPMTWEVELSKLSKTDYEGRAKMWMKLLETKKMPYMALLRNLRNIIEDASKVKGTGLINAVVELLTNERAVEKSRQLPFRFLSAYREIEKVTSVYTSQVLDAIQVAATYAVKNLKIEGTAAMFCDVSGSMESTISDRSDMRMVDIGLMFGWMVKVINKNSVTGVFGNTAKFKNVSGNSVFDLYMKYKEGEVGYSTNWHLAIDLLLKEGIAVDKIFLFTDCQMYGGSVKESFKRYRAKFGNNVKLYVFDLSGSNTNVSNEDNVYTISGWSDKVFEYIEILENLKKSTIVNEIRESGEKYQR